MPSPSSPRRQRLIQIFFFAAFAVLLYQLYLITQPFFSALLAAALLTLAFHPLNKRLRKMTGKPALAALLMTVGVVLVVVVPLLTMLWVLLREAGRFLPTVQNIVSNFHDMDYASVAASLPHSARLPFLRLGRLLQEFNIHPKGLVLDNVQQIGAMVASWGGFALQDVFFTLFQAAMMVIALFFGFRNGEELMEWIFSLIPMEVGNKATLVRRSYETFWAVTVGVFLTAIAQGAVATLGFLIAGVRLPVFLGAATAMASLLGGSFIVTVPVAVFAWADSRAWGIFLVVWVGVVTIMEHVLKPILIGSRARMPLVLIFFSIIGGVKEYGLFGIILGPMLVAVILTFVKIYQDQYGAKS